MAESDKNNAAGALASFEAYQDRVNERMFNAIQLLGRRLERTEVERDRFSRRLKGLETFAKRDPKTGQLYLPAVTELPANLPALKPPSWLIGGSVLSGALAVAAMVMVMTKEPLLTDEQLQIINSPQFAQLSLQLERPWNVVEYDQYRQEDETTAMARIYDDIPERPSFEEVEKIFPVEKGDIQLAFKPENISPAAGGDATEVIETVELNLKPEPLVTTKTVIKNTVSTPETKNKPIALTVASAKVAPSGVTGAVEKQIKTVEDVIAHAAQGIEQDEPISRKTITSTASKTKTAVQKRTITAKKKEIPVSVKKISAVKKQILKKTAALKSALPSRAQIKTTSKGIPATLEPDPYLAGKFKILEERAFEGIPEAQHDLATLYAAGDVVNKSYKRAAHWFSKASEQGIANAHYNLGVMYHQGLGMKANLKEALAWYHNAAELGHPEALYNLGIAYVEGVGAGKDIERGASFFKRAAHAGVAQAAYNLAILYESSFLGGENKGQAVEWYELAAQQGHVEARSSVARLSGKTYSDEDQVLAMASNIEPAAGTNLSNDLDAQRVVSMIQKHLISNSLLPLGSADGVVDAQTEDAIRSYQKTTGISIDGRATRTLLKHMLYAGVNQ